MRTTIPLICPQCHEPFLKELRRVNYNKKHGFINLCSHKCSSLYKLTVQPVQCLNCKTTFLKRPANIRTSPNHFCSKSCAATYNNKNKSYGYRRSKLEVYIEDQIKIEFPDLELIVNGKETIGSELDLFFPDLNLAIEISGIFHYEPIFGQDKLDQIVANDNKKVTACNLLNIDLIQYKHIDKHLTAEIKAAHWHKIKGYILVRYPVT